MYRDLIPPPRALQGLLHSLSSRLLSVERRGTWPGAVQFAELASPITMSVDNVWEPIVSINLDPGRWTLYGVATVSSLDANALQQIRIPATNSTPSVSTALYAGFGPGQISLSIIGTVVNIATTVITLEAASAAAADTEILTASIIATPV